LTGLAAKFAANLQFGVPRTPLKPRIHIIGGSGSGKSYIAAKLARHFGVPTYDLDDLFWDRATGSYGFRTDPTKRDQQLIEIVAQDGWIIEGVYYQWLTPSFDVADVTIALTPSIWIRHWRVVRRFILRKLGRLPSKHESFDDLWRLLRWSQAYDAVNLVQARKFIADRGRQIVDCKTFADVLAVTEYLDKLQRKVH
jgi:adenylate kinase family enzyme